MSSCLDCGEVAVVWLGDPEDNWGLCDLCARTAQVLACVDCEYRFKLAGMHWFDNDEGTEGPLCERCYNVRDWLDLDQSPEDDDEPTP